MIRKLFLQASGLILFGVSCKEVTPTEAAVQMEVIEPAVSVIPERPTEIEVLDLTGDVDLFVVIAGAYSSAEGAQKKADALKNAGFVNADIVQRPGSKLYSALVERFDSESSAKEFAEKIATNNEIKSFVYKLDH